MRICNSVLVYSYSVAVKIRVLLRLIGGVSLSVPANLTKYIDALVIRYVYSRQSPLQSNVTPIAYCHYSKETIVLENITSTKESH